MTQLLKKIIRKLLVCPVYLLLKIVLSAARENARVREVLMGISALVEDSRDHFKERRIREKYEIHPSAKWGATTLIYGNGRIVIGEDSYLGENCMVLANKSEVKVVIGKFCAISHNVQIRTEINKKTPHFRQDRYELPMAGADVVIGDYVWIGSNVFIGGGIKIGDNSIIGANSVVTHDVPADTVYAGVPARLIRRKSDYEKKNP